MMEHFIHNSLLFLALLTASYIIQLLLGGVSKSYSRQLLLALLCVNLFFWIGLYIYGLTENIFIAVILWSANLIFFPAYYLYVESLTRESFRIKRQYIFYFFPFFIFLIIFLSLLAGHYLTGTTGKEESQSIRNNYYSPIMISYKVLMYVNLSQFLLYILLMILSLYRHREKIKEYFSYKDETISLKWLYFFVIIVFIFHSIYISYDFFRYKKPAYFSNYIVIIRYLYILFLGIFGLRQVDIYRSKKAGLKEDINTIAILAETTINKAGQEMSENLEDTNDSDLLDNRRKRIMEKIDKVMNERKLYRNPKLNLYDLAGEIYTNKTYVSMAINEIMQMNFNVYINTLRVEEAGELLRTKLELPINEIMEKCGFNSRSAFNDSFKKIKGVSPSAYRKSR